MLAGYHVRFRQVLGSLTLKPAAMPKANLTVDSAGENMARLAISYRGHNTGNQKDPVLVADDYSQIETNRALPFAKASDFPREGWLGEGVYY